MEGRERREKVTKEGIVLVNIVYTKGDKTPCLCGRMSRERSFLSIFHADLS